MATCDDNNPMRGGANFSSNDHFFHKNRSIIASATNDTLDQDQPCFDDSTMSIASTVDVDNTSCYLLRFADKFAHEKNECETVVQFVRVNKFKIGQNVLYTTNGLEWAMVVDVYYEDNNTPRYSIELTDGYIEAYVHEDQLSRWEKTEISNDLTSKSTARALPNHDHVTDASTKLVDFDLNPTPLFTYIYSGKFEEAKIRLESHPEEASVWVVRSRCRVDASKPKATKLGSNDTTSSIHVRWRLLPLHLLIVIVGSHANINSGIQIDVPLQAVPRFQLLTALLATYPDATKCVDDQNMIPLHSSIRGQSPTCIIHALLDAYPESVYWQDPKGRNAFALLEKVFKKLMKHAVVHTKVENVSNDALKVSKWKQEVLHLLTGASKRVSTAGGHDQECSESSNNHSTHTQLQKLQKENMILSPNNAIMQNEAKQDEENIKQLNYNEIFGSKDEVDKRREEILLAISNSSENEETAVRNATIEKNEPKYLQLNFSTPDNSTVTEEVTPCSTMTTLTEITTPMSASNELHTIANPTKEIKMSGMNWETRCRMLEMQSYDDEDQKSVSLVSGGGANNIDGRTLLKSNSIFRSCRAASKVADTKSLDLSISSSSVRDNDEGIDNNCEYSPLLAAIFPFEEGGDCSKIGPALGEKVASKHMDKAKITQSPGKCEDIRQEVYEKRCHNLPNVTLSQAMLSDANSKVRTDQEIKHAKNFIKYDDYALTILDTSEVKPTLGVELNGGIPSLKHNDEKHVFNVQDCTTNPVPGSWADVVKKSC